jgi:hypothetical protein
LLEVNYKVPTIFAQKQAEWGHRGLTPEQEARRPAPLGRWIAEEQAEGNTMKLLSLGLLSVGLILAQSSQSTTTTTDTKSKDHGKHVKSDTTTSTTTTDERGNATTDTSTTKTKAKKHHGKVKATSKTTDSTSTTEKH